MRSQQSRPDAWARGFAATPSKVMTRGAPAPAEPADGGPQALTEPVPAGPVDVGAAGTVPGEGAPGGGS